MAPPDQCAPRPRVVVGLDGSAGGQAALRYALTAAARRGAGLEVLVGCARELYRMSGGPLVVLDVSAIEAAARQRAADVLAEARRTLPGTADVPVDVLSTVQAAAPELVRLAAGADLVVVGSRGHGVVRSALLGSVALHVTTHAPCPVVVVHGPGGDASGALTGSSRVVVGVDGSPSAAAGLAAAVEEAARLDADLDVVACFTMETYWSDLWQVMVPPVSEVRDDVRREAEAQLAAVLAARPAGTPEPRAHVEVVEGAPSDVLVRRARDAALLVVGSRGRGAVRAALLGSVALHCVMHASCPVLVVHPSAARAPQAALSGTAPA